MTTKSKNRWLISLCACAALALPLCFMPAAAKAEPEQAQPYFYEYDFAKETENEAADFAMANGAALRRAENSGIRFIAGIKSSVFETVKGYEDLELGVLVAPQDLLNADFPAIGDAAAVNITYSGEEIEQYTFKASDKETQEDYVVFAGSVVDITANNFNRPLAASAYYKYTGAEGETVVYAVNEGAESVRSLSQVAKALQGSEEYAAYDEADKATVDRYADKYQIADRILWAESEGAATSPQFVIGESSALYFDVTGAATVTVAFADGTASVVKDYAEAAEGARIELGAYAGKTAAVTMTAGAANARMEEYVMPKIGAVDFAADDYTATLAGGTGSLSVVSSEEYDSVLQMMNGQDQLYTTTEFRFGENFLSQINDGDTVKFSFRILPNTCDNDFYKFRSTWLTDAEKHFYCCYSDRWGVEKLPVNEWIEVTLDAEETQEMINQGGGLRAYVELHGAEVINHQYILQYADFRVVKNVQVKPTDVVTLDVEALFDTEGLTNFAVTPVSYDGAPITEIPAGMTVPEGEHVLVVSVSAEGYRDTQITINVLSARERVVFYDFEDGLTHSTVCGKPNAHEVVDKYGNKMHYVKNGTWESYGYITFAFTQEQMAQIQEGDQLSFKILLQRGDSDATGFQYHFYNQFKDDAGTIEFTDAYQSNVELDVWQTITLSAEDTMQLNNAFCIWVEQSGNTDWYHFELFIDDIVLIKA